MYYYRYGVNLYYTNKGSRLYYYSSHREWLRSGEFISLAELLGARTVGRRKKLPEDIPEPYWLRTKKQKMIRAF